MESYLTLKCVHLFGVVVFLGNIVVTGWWKFMADRTGRPEIVAFAQRQVTLTDFVFTGGGALLLGIGGIGNAMLHHMDFLHVKWLAWGFWQFAASGAIWLLVLIPVQIRQAKMASTFREGGTIPQSYRKLALIWNVFGTLATLIPLSNIYWMVFKPI